MNKDFVLSENKLNLEIKKLKNKDFKKKEIKVNKSYKSKFSVSFIIFKNNKYANNGDLVHSKFNKNLTVLRGRFLLTLKIGNNFQNYTLCKTNPILIKIKKNSYFRISPITDFATLMEVTEY